MLLIHGKYQFGQRKIGAQKDFCNACERECLSELWRSFHCLHLFWIPFLPLGWRERWQCTLCNQEPRKRFKTRRGFKIAGLIALAIFLISMFAVEVDPKELGTIWGMRIALAIGFVALLYSVLKPQPPLSDDERRKLVSPLSADSCVYCRGPLVGEPALHCPSCQIRIYTEQRVGPPPEPQYPDCAIETVLSQLDPDHAMSGLLACMEDEGLWVNTVTRRVGCLGIVYWRTACDGVESVISENGPPVVREAMVLLEELGAEKCWNAWKEIFALFPGGSPPDDYPACESAVEALTEHQKEQLERLSSAFETAFYETEKVLGRLHAYVAKHKDQFRGRAIPPKIK